MNKFDLHVHTEATAPYMKGDARLTPYHERGKARNLVFMGISDHYHYFWQATKYVREQRAHIDTAKFANPRMYLGVEQTILGDKGQIGIRGSGREVLDYIILSIHWMSVGGRLDRTTIAGILQSPAKASRLVETAKRYYLGGITNPKLARLPKIIGHPFNFIASQGGPVPGLFDAVDWLCKLCAENHVAYEVNIDAVPKDVSRPTEQQDAYWRHLAESLNSHQPRVAISSDAHHLEAIGNVDPAIACMERYGCKPSLLLDESFFNR